MTTSADDAVEEVLERRDELRARALAVVGLGDREREAPPAPLRKVLREHSLSIYPMMVIGALHIVDTVYLHVFTVLSPEISRSLGVGKDTIAAVGALGRLAAALSPLAIAVFAQKPRRALLALVTAALWSLATLLTGYVALIWGLLAVLVLDGLSTGASYALHQPLLLDTYPPAARVRAMSFYNACSPAGLVLAPLGVTALTALGFTWRGTFVAFGLLCIVATVLALRLRDPGFGKWDTERLREVVREAEGGSETGPNVELGFFEIVQRLFLIPTVRRLLVGIAVFGILLVPYLTFMQFFLEERWRLGPGERGLVLAFQSGASVVALVVFGKFGERLFRRDPGLLMRVASVLLALGVLVIGGAGLSPWFPVTVGLIGLAGGLVAITAPALNIVLLSVVPARMRPHAAGLLGIFAVGVGGTAGLVFLSGIDRRFGVGGSIVSLVVPGVIGALLMARAGRHVRSDMERMVDELIEDEEIRQMTAAGRHLPLLACRGIDFSYGPIQILFDVDFTVDDGEMVALLGVNGAGKSTLLRVISGLGLPTAGSVRLHGLDITFLDATRRVRLGITQVPGGKAVFGNMSVVDNLRAYGYTLGTSKAAVDRALDVSFDTFPRLAERRNQAAATLSGGEQQMLALSKALMLQPRLLLIDELSLGLAPVIVGQLLEIVRRINAEGTAVVLVEQSVNIALQLVDHAYFMEKGQIRFDGPSRELLARDDLLRAVFLDGSAAVGSGS
jgi:ABC-type branched-subunit amino acid transport system ATPase component/sugar phosphate permease